MGHKLACFVHPALGQNVQAFPLEEELKRIQLILFLGLAGILSATGQAQQTCGMQWDVASQVFRNIYSFSQLQQIYKSGSEIPQQAVLTGQFVGYCLQKSQKLNTFFIQVTANYQISPSNQKLFIQQTSAQLYASDPKPVDGALRYIYSLEGNPKDTCGVSFFADVDQRCYMNHMNAKQISGTSDLILKPESESLSQKGIQVYCHLFKPAPVMS